MSATPLFRNRDFLLLWGGQAVSQVGDRVQQIALVWWALEHGGTAAGVSTALVAVSLPVVLVSLYAGVAVDRYDRRWIMIGCDAARAVLVGLVALLAWRDQLTLPLLLASTALISAIGAFFGPAAMAALPDVVAEQDLVRANALQETTLQGSMVAGPALGGLLVGWLGVPAAFAANALSFLLCALALLAARLPRRGGAAAGESAWRQFLDGLALLRDDRSVAALLGLFAVANFFLAPITVFLPYYARDVFHAGAQGLGILEAALGVGLAAGALALAGGGGGRRRAAIQAGLLVPGVCLVWMGLQASFYGFLAALFVLGAAISVLNVVAISYFQEVVPADCLGRFMGLLMTVVLALMPASYALSGVVALGVPAGIILAAGGLVLAVIGVAVPLIPALRPLASSPARGGS